MEFCIACGTQRPPDQRFCMRCGAPFPAADEMTADTSTFVVLSPPEAPQRPATSPSGRRRAGWVPGLAIGATAILAAAVVGFLVTRHHPPPRASQAGATATSSPTGLAPTRTTTTAPPSTEAPTPTTPAPYQGNSVVSVGPAAAQHPLARTVVALLTRYFDDINNRDFGDYILLYDQQTRDKFDVAHIAAGYRSSEDSEGRLVGLGTAADGRTQASVTFTSTQNADDGPDHETCTHWILAFFLQAEGSNYVFGPPPTDYHAQHAVC